MSLLSSKSAEPVSNSNKNNNSASPNALPEEEQPTTPPPPLTTTEKEKEKTYLTGLKLLVLLASLTLVTFLVLLDTAVLGTAIPHLTTEFHSLPDVGWYVGAYTLAA